MRLLGAVLAGGKATRFGSDKMLAQWRGQPLIAHGLALLAPHCADVIICGRSYGDYRWVTDRPDGGLDSGPDKGQGPLGGLNAALHMALQEGYDAVLSLPCDMPVIDLMPLLSQGSSLSRNLGQNVGQEVAPRYFTAHPVVGLWPASLAATLDTWLAAQPRRAMMAFIAHIQAQTHIEPVEGGEDFPNINRPQDLDRL